MSKIAYLPMWTVCVLWSAALSLFSLVGVIYVRLRTPATAHALRFHNELVGCDFAAVAVFYGVTLGLITASVWTNYADAEKAVGVEVAAINGVFRTAAELPDVARLRIQQDAIDYVRWVGLTVWPHQRSGESTDGDDQSLDAMQRDILAEHARTGDCSVNSEMLSRLNGLIAARQTRVNEASIALPSIMWWFVCMGSVFTLAPTWFFRVERLRTHAALTTMLSVLIGLSISLVMLLDNPLHGDVSIENGQYLALQQGMVHAMQLGTR